MIQKKETIIIASSRSWNNYLVEELSKKTDYEVKLISHQNELVITNLEKIKPVFVFFPHWSYLIPEEIYDYFNCIVFHMTDLPFGRGGSPLQNLLVRGIYKTKISALKVVKELDAGPVYLKKDLSLEGGNAEELFLRASAIIEEMILEILETKPTPVEQTGEITLFQRRKPEESNMQNQEFDHLDEIFDFIRMLDAPGYPNAYIKLNNFLVTFEKCHLSTNEIQGIFKITKHD